MRNKILFASLIIILAFFNYSIFKQENHINKGATIYFELAPVDPRSLMQGDYMALRYQVADDIAKAYEYEKADVLELPNNKAIIELDESKRAKFISLYNKNDELRENQFLLDFIPNRHQFKTALASSYFFEEGQAKNFEIAKYGVFKHMNDRFVLVALADKDLKIIEAK